MGDRSPDQCLWRSSELIAYFDMGLEIWRFRDPDISIARVGEVVAGVFLAGQSTTRGTRSTLQ